MSSDGEPLKDWYRFETVLLPMARAETNNPPAMPLAADTDESLTLRLESQFIEQHGFELPGRLNIEFMARCSMRLSLEP